MSGRGKIEELSRSTKMASDDGDIRRSLRKGSQDWFDYYCEPCDTDHKQIEAMFYCNNCHEYMCNKCNVYHRKFKTMNDHDIVNVRHMTHKPQVGKKPPTSTRAVTMATHVKDFDVEGFNTSFALLSSSQLLIADRENRRVILVDTGSDRQISELNLSHRPWQATRISDTEAAVTIPDDTKIVLLKTQPQFSEIREINLEGKCFGLAYSDNKLIITFLKQHVNILDMSGKLIRTIKSDQTGKKIFTNPRYVTVNAANGIMYVSDWEFIGAGKVIKLSKEGNVLATYRRDRYGIPNQLALDGNGMVYVAWTYESGQSGSVEQLNVNCGKVRTILPDPLAKIQTQALSYDKATQLLYVGLHFGVVKIYRLS